MKTHAMHRVLTTQAPPATLLIRVMVGGIFLSEGIQKFLYPGDLGAGRFERIGIPAPELMGPFVAGTECLCGALVLLGLFTRPAVVPLLVAMCVAMISIKLPILLGHGFWGFSLRPLPRYGFWSMMHESRNDLCMIFGSLFLLIVGAGRISLDAYLLRRTGKKSETD
jgi:putative oxidoreductase